MARNSQDMNEKELQSRSNYSPQHWASVETLFHSALEQPIERQIAFVQREAADDPALCDEVIGLVNAYQDSSVIVDRPAFQVTMAPNRGIVSPLVNQTIGNYRVLRILGSGGMGIVYEAEQEKLSRRVALKVLRDTHFVDTHRIDLFAREIRALATLSHTGIARIFEAGATAEGLPFFTMELINGESLNRCRQAHNLGAKEKLRLFIRICDAVQHAHDRGVIHRDLKPTNIMITRNPVVGASEVQASVQALSASILDFGLARLTKESVLDQPTPTSTGQMFGTPAYISPEQILGHSLSNTGEQSDVYALGVILYEWLSGEHPYATSGMTPLEVAQRACEDSRKRYGKIQRDLQGDIKAVVFRAMEKDRKLRYQSVAELSKDIRSILTGYPVIARRQNMGYVARRFAMRHRVALLVMLVVIGALGAAWRAKQQELQASQSIASLALPFDQRTMRIRLHNADVSNVKSDLQVMPVQAVNIDHAIALMQGTHEIRNGNLSSAEEHLLTAKSVLDDRGGKPVDEYVRILRNLAMVYQLTNRNHEALKANVEIRTVVMKAYGPESAEGAIAQRDAARSLVKLGRFAQARIDLEKSRKILLARLGSEHHEFRVAELDRAVLEAADGNAKTATDMAVHLLNNGPLTMDIQHLPLLHMAARLLSNEYRFGEAEAVLAEARRIVEANGPNLNLQAKHIAHSAHLRIGKGELASGVIDLERALEMLRINHVGHNAGIVPSIQVQLAGAYWLRGDYEKAELVIRAAINSYFESDPQCETLKSLSARNSLAVILRDNGKDEDAFEFLLATLKSSQKTFGNNHLYVANAHINLAKYYLTAGILEKAQEHAERCREIRKCQLDATHIDHCETKLVLAKIDAQNGCSRHVSERMNAVVKLRIDRLGYDHVLVAESRLALAKCLLNQGAEAGAYDQLTLAESALKASELLPTHKFWRILRSISAQLQ